MREVAGGCGDDPVETEGVRSGDTFLCGVWGCDVKAGDGVVMEGISSPTRLCSRGGEGGNSISSGDFILAMTSIMQEDKEEDANRPDRLGVGRDL